jgi:hypothetical protein
MACEVFKATRSSWLTRAELAKATGCSVMAAGNWADEYAAQGILQQRQREKRDGVTGYAPTEFTLAPAWGGQGFGSPQDEADRVASSVGHQTQQTQTGMR